MRKYIRNTAITIGAAGMLCGLFALKERQDERQREYKIESPYGIKIENKWGYLTMLADENKDGRIDRTEGKKMHAAMNVGDGIYLISMDRGEVPVNLKPFDAAINRAITTYELGKQK